MTYKRKEIIGPHTLYLGDCREVLADLLAVNAAIDAVVTDPPYGIGEKWDRAGCFGSCGGRLWNGDAGWDGETSPEALAAAMAAADGRGIVWGGNYYDLPPSRGYLVWDKMQSGFTLADSELAWCSDPITPKTFRFARAQLASEGKIHPTQKPLGLMTWCIELLPRPNRTILDPFMGSGTTLVACQKLGRIGIGIEIEPKYFDIACRRVEEAMKQPDLFVETPKPPKQLDLMEAAE